MNLNRRNFLKSSVLTGSCAGLSNLAFLAQLRPVSAAEARLDPRTVQCTADIEPLVRFLEDTPQERLLEETAKRIHRGLSYQQLLAALLLAGVRNIQPRPVGFKFHAVLVVNSAHLASLASPDSERWLPVFWALDYFKSSQARDVREGDWTMAPVEESKVPAAHKARKAFTDAMDNWDESAADVAVAGLVRTAGANELFDLFSYYGARDFRDIGHKAIYVANSFRTLQAIGWRHAEPVLRSLAYALLMHDPATNPAKADLSADRPGRRNLESRNKLRTDWMHGRIDSKATADVLSTIRDGSSSDMSDQVIRMINGGVAPQSIWDGLFDGAGELLMRVPGILSLHAVTCANALHHAWQQTHDDNTRRFLLLQAASFLPRFRSGNDDKDAARIDQLKPLATESKGAEGINEIFHELSDDRMTAARKAFGWLNSAERPETFLDAARLMIFFKGRNAHDYKFSSAVLEDYLHLSPQWRNRFLASSVFYWRGAAEPDNTLLKRTRAALAS